MYRTTNLFSYLKYLMNLNTEYSKYSQVVSPLLFNNCVWWERHEVAFVVICHVNLSLCISFGLLVAYLKWNSGITSVGLTLTVSTFSWLSPSIYVQSRLILQANLTSCKLPSRGPKTCWSIHEIQTLFANKSILPF